MSRLTELCFELNQPYPPKFKNAYFKIPTNNSYIFEEILRDINKIVNNSDHEQAHEYIKAVKTYNRIKCWFYMFLSLSILIAVAWSCYIFLICDLIKMDNCDYMNYNNIINQTLWGSFCVVLVTTLSLILCGFCVFSNKSKRISQKWRISIKLQIHRYVVQRRKKSPQYLFELNYRGTNGFIMIRRGAGKTPTVTPTADSKNKEYDIDIKPNKKKRRSKNKKGIHNIEIDQELAYLNATNTTPITEYSTTEHQISTEILQEYAKENSAMLNALINAPSVPNLNQDISNSKSNLNMPFKSNITPIPYDGGSQSNLNQNIVGNLFSSQTNLAMKQLPPIIPNPVDLDAINKPIHQQNNHHFRYNPQNNNE